MSVNLKPTPACAIAALISLAIPTRAWANAAPPGLPGAARAVLTSTSDKADNSNPYAIIVDRNIFRLNPPPPPVVAEVKPVELPKVFIGGIMKIGNDVRVLFSIPAKDAKGQTSYLKLAPGEKQNELELVRIHPDQQGVDVLVNGTAESLSVLSNSLAASGGKAAPAAPGPAPGPAPQAAAAATSPSAASILAGGERDPYRYRNNVTVAGGGGGDAGGVTVIGASNNSPFGGVTVAGGSANNGANQTPYGNGGGVMSPGGTQYATTLASAAQNATPGRIATPEEQAANMIIQQALAGGKGPPLPPPIAQAANELGVGGGTGGTGGTGATGGPPSPYGGPPAPP